MVNQKDVKAVFVAASVATAVLAFMPGAAGAEWPERPVTIIVPAGAGGGTDATGRLLAAELTEIFGQQFNVVNQAQGGGLVGIMEIAQAKPDGYSLGILTSYVRYNLLGQADVTSENFTPIAQYNLDPAGFQVRADAPYDNLEEALDAIKADPGSFTFSCGGSCGNAWSLALAKILNSYDVENIDAVSMIPAKGAAEGLQELAAGGVDGITSSIPEAGPLISAGKVKSLAVFSDSRIPAFPDIPTVSEELGIEVEGGAWRGLAGPAGLPEGVVDKLEAAVKDIYDSEDFREAMTSRGFGLKWRSQEEFAEFLKQHEVETATIFEELGWGD